MKNIKYIIYLIFVINTFSYNVNYSQKLFNTKQGTIIINAKINDSSLSIPGKAVIIDLDYAAATMKIEYNLNSLNTGIDSLDLLLAESRLKIILDAKLGIPEIETKSHAEQKFIFEGIVSDNKSNIKLNVLGNGTLQHISDNSGIASCVLWLRFGLDAEKLDWNLSRYGIYDELDIQIIQAILTQVK